MIATELCHFYVGSNKETKYPSLKVIGSPLSVNLRIKGYFIPYIRDHPYIMTAYGRGYWVGRFRKLPFFLYVQFCNYADIVGGFKNFKNVLT